VAIWLTFLGGIIIAAITALGTWLVAKRGKSGTVVTSEAETLWAQAQEMRTELRAEVTRCAEKLKVLDEENTRLRQGLIQAEEKILAQRQELQTVREDLHQTREDLQVALREVSKQVHDDVSTVKQELALIQGGMTG
jgi:chromosome segregation ATPase